jgi:fatty-acyl-CoA synthase
MSGAVGLTPLRYLRYAASAAAGRTAWVDGGRTVTWAEMEERCRRLAAALRRSGVAQGDRVAVLSPNSVATLEAHFGVAAAGAVLVALNTRLTRDELAFIVGDCEPSLVLVDPELGSLVPAGGPRRISLDDYESFVGGAVPQADLLDHVSDERATVSLNYTSGTTGRPRGAIYTHRGAYLQALNAQRGIALEDDSVLLWTLPMFHCNGWTYPWAGTAALASHVILRSIDPGLIWRLIDEHHVTHYCCAPTVQLAILSDPAAHRTSRSVRVAMGGAPPSPTLIAQMRELGFDAMHLYGLTETYGPKAGIRARAALLDGLDPHGQARVLARQGYALSPTDELSVVGDDMQPVARDGRTPGQVVIRGETVTPGYFNCDEATDEAFRDGWLLTGDVAVWHVDGAIELRDRIKDVIISGGENISSIEVEQVLMAHPAVLEAAVVSVPDERWGERPKGFVILRDGAGAGADELIAFCRERLAHFKCPDIIEFSDLPKTATGKVKKRELREREWAGLQRRVS